MLSITPTLCIADDEIQLDAIRAQGSGGQNVNKVSSAVHLRFDIHRSSLPELYKQRLLALKDARVSSEGVIVIKAQQFRSQPKNREDALRRLADLIRAVTIEAKPRRPTKPSVGAKQKRIDSKKRQGQTKSLRGKVEY